MAFVTLYSSGRGNNYEKISRKNPLDDTEIRTNRHAEAAWEKNSIVTYHLPFSFRSKGDKGLEQFLNAERVSGNVSTVENSKTYPLPLQQPAGSFSSSAADGFEKGKKLVANSGCISCHQIDQKITGPAYIEIAKKYTPTEANIVALTAKIINGGAGNWGQMSMDPHPYLREVDVREMVKYILSLHK
ncbi:hypothetical protein BH24BAC1_BH24BAC1_39440 [soil metagenome]